jgi:tRNA pseudouridine32 synthase/23S rRNA pseudouridine746 synthase/23S rRNA pseudouridine1911/1915/1917 synthase
MKSPKKFKAPPKRFQPKGLTVLYEDQDILVVDKSHGLLTVGTGNEKTKTAYFRLTDYVRRGNPKSRNRIFIVHRLDKDTSGLLVFAKTVAAKRYLQDNWQQFSKKYSAVIVGVPEKEEDTISSYLVENSIHKMYSVNNPEKGQFAQTGYKVLQKSKRYSLLEIDLLTGRKNQIRVHFAEMNHPVAGDKKYGEKQRGIKRLTLHAAKLTISHPHTKQSMTFESKTPGYFYSLLAEK